MKRCAVCEKPLGKLSGCPVFAKQGLVMRPVKGIVACYSCGRSGANVVTFTLDAGVRG